MGLSIGADTALDREHLTRLKSMQDWLQPTLFSEHLAWSSHGRNYLLPLPYRYETLIRVAEHIDQLQQTLGRQVLLANPSSYLCYNESLWHEAEFLSEVIHRSACGLLLDVNNVFVSAKNLHFDADDYLSRLPLSAVGEIHIAEHAINRNDRETPLIDSHDEPIADKVWALFGEVLKQVHCCPVLIERDGNLPPFDELCAEARLAASAMEGVSTAA